MKVFSLIARWFNRSGVVEQVNKATEREMFSLSAEIEQLFKRQNSKLGAAFDQIEEREKVSYDRIMAALTNAQSVIAELRKAHGELLQEVATLHARLNSFASVTGDHFDRAVSNRVTVSKKLDVLMERPFHNIRELKAAISSQLEKQLALADSPPEPIPAPDLPFFTVQDFIDKSRTLLNNTGEWRQFQDLKWYSITRGQVVARVQKLAKERKVEPRSVRIAKWRKSTSTYPLPLLIDAARELISETLAAKKRLFHTGRLS